VDRSDSPGPAHLSTIASLTPCDQVRVRAHWRFRDLRQVQRQHLGNLLADVQAAPAAVRQGADIRRARHAGVHRLARGRVGICRRRHPPLLAVIDSTDDDVAPGIGRAAIGGALARLGDADGRGEQPLGDLLVGARSFLFRRRIPGGRRSARRQCCTQRQNRKRSQHPSESIHPQLPSPPWNQCISRPPGLTILDRRNPRV